MKELLYTVVFLLIGGPFVWIDIKKIDLLKLLEGKLAAFRNYINIKIILNAL